MGIKKRLYNFLFDVFDMLSFLVFVCGIVLFIRFFVANPYTVVGASMDPTFKESDFIIVDKITPRFGQLQRGDVIVFVPPGKDIPYIKRIIGLPNETIKLNNGGVSICYSGINDCKKLDEKYLSNEVKTYGRCGISEFKIDDKGYFAMGDNREFSTDSRCCFGLDCYQGSNYEVPFNNIIGKVYIRFFPNFSTF
ncbi:MAG: signal peptidase I [Candidatus Absconditabacterales bacterium]